MGAPGVVQAIAITISYWTTPWVDGQPGRLTQSHRGLAERVPGSL
jgi:hypothetical protein